VADASAILPVTPPRTVPPSHFTFPFFLPIGSFRGWVFFGDSVSCLFCLGSGAFLDFPLPVLKRELFPFSVFAVPTWLVPLPFLKLGARCFFFLFVLLPFSAHFLHFFLTLEFGGFLSIFDESPQISSFPPPVYPVFSLVLFRFLSDNFPYFLSFLFLRGCFFYIPTPLRYPPPDPRV